MADLPTGTVTFLFTNIEGSTARWEQRAEGMQTARAHHDAILRGAILAHRGAIVKMVGDGFLAAFATPADGVAAALAAQRALHATDWKEAGPVGVRMALHTGAAEERDGDYFGPTLNRAARLMAVAHGGQVLLSRAALELTRDLLAPGVEVRDLGEHRLKDLSRPERIFQVVAPDLPAIFAPLRTLDAQANNLPHQPTLLVGRDQELAALAALLRRTEARLVTLTGPGGTGKTRLALQAATDFVDDCADGVWFIDLAPISDPGLVASTIGHTLGLKETGGQPLLDGLKSHLRDKQLLLVLDNFEQVVSAAHLLTDLLATSPRLKVLVTSREVLRLAGEHEYPVPPLALPPSELPPVIERLEEYAAVALFVERARAANPDFKITGENAPAVAAICARLDGLPLALELAAARIKVLPPAALLARLDNRLKLLTDGARDRGARQQTLRGAIDWSYHLLLPDEQALFRRLGLFVGGCTLEAVEAVCDAAGNSRPDVLDLVASLVDKSLLRQEQEPAGDSRFSMLETIREYAREQLATSGETRLFQHHAAYYLAFAEQAARELTGQHQAPWLRRLDAEQDNLRAALTWGL